MKPFKVYMWGTNPRYDKKNRILSGIGGIIIITLFFTLDVFNDYFALLIGILCVIAAFGYNYIIKRSFVLINDKGIKAEFKNIDNLTLPLYLGKLNKVYVKWEEIQSISKKPFDISITLKNGTEKEVYIGDIPYKKHQELKEILQEYIEEKGITTTI